MNGRPAEPLEIDPDYLCRTLLELLAIPSPSGYTDNVVRYVSRQLQDLCIEHELTRRGAIRANLYGEQRSPDRAIVSHIDTTGAMVTRVKDNGRLAITPIGTWSPRFAEGARVSVLTREAAFRGTILPLLASGHRWGDAIDTQPVSWDNVEVRVDAVVSGPDDVRALGIDAGDYVAIDPCPEITDTGYVSSRHLDNKAGVACVLAAARALLAARADFPLDCHLLFTIFEEVGSGASAVLHQDVAELVSIDNGTTDGLDATVALMDSAGPFDYHLSHKLIDLAHEHDIPVRRDVFKVYRSDGAAAVDAGNDIRTALLCFGCDGSHGYERTHLESLIAVSRLITVYVQSPPVAARDRWEMGPINGFTEQPLAPEEGQEG